MSKTWKWKEGGEAAFRKKTDTNAGWMVRIVGAHITRTECGTEDYDWTYPCCEWSEVVEQVEDLPPCRLCGRKPESFVDPVDGVGNLYTCENDHCSFAGGYNAADWTKLHGDRHA